MTFTEAAIEVLRREGKPLHFKKITEIAIRENLLDHVGKIPEEIMADQVAAHCRLPRVERRMLSVQHGTFALVEWGLDEDPAGLEHLVELPPVDDLPYRGRERHPMPMRDLGRAGRGDKPRRRDEGEERHGRRFPPPAEVAYEILAGAGHALALTEVAAQGAERLLMPDAFVRDTAALAAALMEDNRRRESAGRHALFEVDGDTVTLVAQPEPGERAAAPLAPVRAATAADLRRAGLVAVRRRLRECDAATVEHVVARLLEKLGYRELKVAKRGREHVIYTGRRKMGLADVRHCFRVIRTGGEAGRRDVVDTRRDLGNYGAQIGVVLTAGEAARDARSEAAAAGQLPVLLLCGEALAEAFADASVGCAHVMVPEVDDAFFAAAAEAAGREETARRARREERDRRDGERPPREEREEREGRRERRPDRPERPAPAPAAEGAPAIGGEGASAEPSHVPAATAAAAPAEAEGLELERAVAPAEASGEGDDPSDDDARGEGEGDADGEEGDEGDEGDDDEAPGAEAGAPGAGEPRPAGEAGRRRRRRRRRRGGRGRGEKREGAGGQAQGGAPASGGEPAGGGAPAAPASPPPGGAAGGGSGES